MYFATTRTYYNHVRPQRPHKRQSAYNKPRPYLRRPTNANRFLLGNPRHGPSQSSFPNTGPHRLLPLHVPNGHPGRYPPSGRTSKRYRKRSPHPPRSPHFYASAPNPKSRIPPTASGKSYDSRARHHNQTIRVSSNGSRTEPSLAFYVRHLPYIH